MLEPNAQEHLVDPETPPVSLYGGHGAHSADPSTLANEF